MFGVGPKLWSTSNETCASALAAVASTPTAVVMVSANEGQRVGRAVIICPPCCHIIREPSPHISKRGSRLHARALVPRRQMLCPASPTLGQLRNCQQPGHLIAIARIDAKDISDGEVVVRLLQEPDLVSGAHVALDDDSEIGAGSQRFGEAAWERLVVHPDPKPPTRDSRLGNLENRAPDLPPLADERVVELHPFRGQVLSELAV